MSEPIAPEAIVEQSIQQSIQPRAGGALDLGASVALLFLGFRDQAQAVPGIPVWWSAQRDETMADLFHKLDIIPGVVAGRASAVSEMGYHWADEVPQTWQRRVTDLLTFADFGEGFASLVYRTVCDLDTLDNGAFWEIIGPGEEREETLVNPQTRKRMGTVITKGPLTGAPTTIAYLDALRCTRTGNPEWPVTYLDPQKQVEHRFHRSRVAALHDMPSGRETRRGVGFSPLSRCLRIAYYVQAINTYEIERMAGRDITKLNVLMGGPTVAQIQDAVDRAQQRFDEAGYERYAPGALVSGERDIGGMGGGDMQHVVLDMGGLIEGFSKEESIRVAVYQIANAFGDDVRTFWTAVTTGATKADAEVSVVTKRNRGLGSRVKQIERAIWKWVLPYRYRGMWRLDYTDEYEEQAALEKRERNTKTIAALWDKGNGIYPSQTAAIREGVRLGVIAEDVLEEAERMADEQEDTLSTQEAGETVPPPSATPPPGGSEEQPSEDMSEGEEEADLEKGTKQVEPPAYTTETLGPLPPEATDDDARVTRGTVREVLRIWRNIPALAPYVPSDEAAREIPTDEGETKALGRKQASPIIAVGNRRGLMDIYLEDLRGRATELGAQLAAGRIDIATWTQEARDLIKQAHTGGMAIGRSGWGVVTQSDWGRVGAAVRGQYRYLDSFARDILEHAQRGEPYSEAYLGNRLGMYADSANASFARGDAVMQGVEPTLLPAIPCDGSTPCLARCQCTWEFEDIGDGLANAYWVLGEADHCPVCLERAAEWAPWGVVSMGAV